MDIILFAVPVFVLLILLELVAEYIKGTDYYRVHDSITSLATGILSRMVKVVYLLVPFTIYVLIFENYSLLALSDSVWIWCLAFVLYDFCYYWNHRLGHEMNLLWAAHVVHHSSEEYNLTTALRQTSTSVLSFLFYLPLAFIGFEPSMIVTVGALNLIYQYWVHTQHIGKLGWFEEFFITPSNHRVHHAQNDIYIDRNYGGVFIIWDRLFNSYQEELDEEPVVFGITGAVRSWNPIWVNAQVYAQLFDDCRRTKSWWHKLTLWFRRTGWRPPDVAKAFPTKKAELSEFEKFDSPMTSLMKVYAIFQYAVNSTIGVGLLVYLDSIPVASQFFLVAYVVLSCFSLGAYMEGKGWARFSEMIKQGLIVAICFAIGAPPGVLLALGVTAVISIGMLLKSSGSAAKVSAA